MKIIIILVGLASAIQVSLFVGKYNDEIIADPGKLAGNSSFFKSKFSETWKSDNVTLSDYEWTDIYPIISFTQSGIIDWGNSLPNGRIDWESDDTPVVFGVLHAANFLGMMSAFYDSLIMSFGYQDMFRIIQAISLAFPGIPTAEGHGRDIAELIKIELIYSLENGAYSEKIIDVLSYKELYQAFEDTGELYKESSGRYVLRSLLRSSVSLSYKDMLKLLEETEDLKSPQVSVVGIFSLILTLKRKRIDRRFPNRLFVSHFNSHGKGQSFVSIINIPLGSCAFSMVYPDKK
jgi:hypothetical protein